VAARQFQVEVSNRRDFDAVVPQEAHPTHADKACVPVDPRREEFVDQWGQDDR